MKYILTMLLRCSVSSQHDRRKYFSRERYIVIHMWKLYNNRTSNDFKIFLQITMDMVLLRKFHPFERDAQPDTPKVYVQIFGLMLWNSVHKQIRSYSVLESFKNQFTRFMLLVPDEPPIRGYKSPNLLSTVVGDYYGQSITALVQTCGRPQKGP